HGGFVLEGGRADHADRVAPLLAQLPFPASWRCIVAVPRGKPGLAGDQEAAVFARLPPPDAHEVERVAHLVLMQLLPALAEADLMGFGAALGEVPGYGAAPRPFQAERPAFPGLIDSRGPAGYNHYPCSKLKCGGVGRWLSPVGNAAPRSVRSVGRPMGICGVDRFSPSSSST